MGPDDIIFPFVNTADIARQAVEACTYPADGGKRGIGPLRAIHYGVDNEPDYLKVAKPGCPAPAGWRCSNIWAAAWD